MALDDPPSGSIRLAELVSALSVATDLGMGQPVEFAMQSCILSVRLGEALGLDETGLREVYYQALLRYIGCNAETDMLAALVGDEIALRHDFAAIDNASLGEIIRLFSGFIHQAHRGAPPFEMIRALAGGIFSLPKVKASFSGHCEVAQRLAVRLGFDENIVLALGQLYERWDGKGAPLGLKGEAIAPAVRIVTLAQDALIYHRLDGMDAATAIARERRGSTYWPAAVDVLCTRAAVLLNGLDEPPTWEALLELEPGARPRLDTGAIDTACETMADFVDLKSPYTLGHSRGVAALAAKATHIAGLPDADVRTANRAGLLHDLGRTGVSSAIWDKPGSLTEREWEKVRLHPYYTERILARPRLLAELGQVAGRHHERQDGSGYYRSLPGSLLPPLVRILAAADVFQALTEARPYRPACSAEQAAAELQTQVRLGKLDPEAVRAVIAAAGLKQARPAVGFTGGLSEREIEVLRDVARGLTTRQIADQLVISPKTADHHIQNLYTKIGVSTRAGATLFALEHHMVGGLQMDSEK
jgi:HD-GYP domain-containing protein (c-di-GMP phosphodiesterase class II)/DNA-binding CsgD family transcriptional regulator